MPAWPTWAQVLNFWLGTIQPWAPASKSPRRWTSTPIQARLAGSLPTLLQPPSQLSQRRHGEMWGWRGGPPSFACLRRGGSRAGRCRPGEGWVLPPLCHALFTVWATRQLCCSPQDTLNNNSLGKKHSWQERVSRSSSPLKTGECLGSWPGEAPCTLSWLLGAWGKWCQSRRLGKISHMDAGCMSIWSLGGIPGHLPWQGALPSVGLSLLLSSPSR